jgi:hypothetical protein
MKTVVTAVILFSLPIIGAVAMNPEAAQKSCKEAIAWAEKTFPKAAPPKDNFNPLQPG